MDIATVKNGGIDAFKLKLLAIFGMTLDHIGIVFGSYMHIGVKTALYALGGLTFPIMAYFMVEGYNHTSNFKRYALRLLAFMLIAQVPYMWAFGGFALSVMATFLLGLLTLYLYDNMKNRWGFWLTFAGFCLVSTAFDWGMIGIPMILLSHIFKGKKRIIIPVLFPMVFGTIQFIMACMLMEQTVAENLPVLAFMFIGCGLTIPLLSKYNGQQGRRIKYLFYIYYPAHLLVLAVLRGVLLQTWWIT